MSDSPTKGPQAFETPEGLLRELDPVLNVFALANGLDLHKNVSGPHDRLLGWYREGMERFLRLEPEPDGTGRFVDWAEALHSRQRAARRGRRPVERALTADSLRRELRALLERGIEQANALGTSDLEGPAVAP